jgi:acetolactate synthase I/II/III large subunit
VGTRYLESLSWGVEGIKTIRIDADTEQADKPQAPDLKIVGTAKKVLGALRAALDSNKKRPSRETELRAVKQQALEKLSVLEPQKTYSDVIRAALPEDGIAVADITQIGFYGWMGYPVYGPRTVIYPGYQDSLGYGFATSLGVKVAHPDRPVIALCGDGGFMFTMPELATAVQHGINVVAIVFNDGGFGNVRRTQKNQFDGHYLGSELKNPDFVALAKSFGAAAFRAESPEALGRVLPQALAAGAPALIEVPVGPMPAWQPLMPSTPVRNSKT